MRAVLAVAYQRQDQIEFSITTRQRSDRRRDSRIASDVTSLLHPFEQRSINDRPQNYRNGRLTIPHFIIPHHLIVATCCFLFLAVFRFKTSFAFGFQGLFPQDALNL